MVSAWKGCSAWQCQKVSNNWENVDLNAYGALVNEEREVYR